jgi:hypothetical protein
MTSHRTISLKTALLLVFLLIFAVPYPALASPLLGGYGGPGEGNQAILGSALVGGAGGGTGGGSSGSVGPGGSAGSSSSLSTGAGASADGEVESTGSSQQGSTTGAETKGSAGGRASGRTPGARERSGKASGGAPRAYPSLPRDDTSQTTSGGSQALGLSVADLGYLLLVLGALGVTGILTRRLVHAPSQSEGL